GPGRDPALVQPAAHCRQFQGVRFFAERRRDEAHRRAEARQWPDRQPFGPGERRLGLTLHSQMARALIAATLLAVTVSAQARELASAPEVSLIGFSRDGRLFAYEQFHNDDVSDTVIAAIDVIARDGKASVKGFPFGFLGVSKNGEFPLRVGGHKI